jgi:hypothetical protein
VATFTDTIQILIKADGAKATSELNKIGTTAQRELDKADKSTRNWSATFTRAGVGLTTFAAVAGAGLYKAAQAADEAQQAQLRLDNTIANSPRLTEKSAAAFRDLATALMQKTVVDDDAIISAEALLGQFKLTEGQILSLTPLVVDLSRKMGVDLDSAAKAVGKAVNGSSGALKRYGVDIKAGADGTIAFDDVVQGLSASVGGFAQGEAQTFTGQIKQMQVQLGEVAENIGAGVIPAFQAMLAPIKAVADGFGSLPPAAQSTIGSIAGIGVAAAGAVGAISLIAGKLDSLRSIALADPTAGLSGGLSTAGKAMGVTAAAAGVLGLAYVAMNARSDEAKQRVDELTNAVRSSGKTLEDVSAQKVADYVGSHEDMRDTLSAAGISTADFAQAVLRGGNTLDDVRAKIEAYAKAQDMSTGAGQVNARNAGILTQELDKQRAAYASSKGDIEGTNKAQKELTGAYQGSTKAAKELGGAAEGAGTKIAGQGDKAGKSLNANELWARGVERSIRATNRHEQAIANLISEIDRYQDVLKGNRDSERDAALAQLDAADAVQGVADAQKSYNDAVAEYGPNSAEAAAAQRELQRAVIGAYQAQDDATQAILDNAAAQAGYDRGAENNIKQTRRYVRELINARNETSGPTRDAINKHIAKILGIPEERATTMTLPEIKQRMRELDDHKKKVDGVPDHKTTTVKLNGAGTARAEADRVKRSLDALHDKTIKITAQVAVEAMGRLANLLGFAEGGRVRGGEPIVVGEQGPELLVDNGTGRTRVIGADGPEVIEPATSGYVIPNDQIQADGQKLRAGMLDNAELSATFTGPVNASSYATIIDDNVLVGKFGDQRRLAGRRQSGGLVEGGQAYLVGESGPELVIPNSDSQVMSNLRLRQMPAAGQAPAGDTIIINFHGPVASQRQAEDWVMNALASAKRRGNRVA